MAPSRIKREPHGGASRHHSAINLDDDDFCTVTSVTSANARQHQPFARSANPSVTTGRYMQQDDIDQKTMASSSDVMMREIRTRPHQQPTDHVEAEQSFASLASKSFGFKDIQQIIGRLHEALGELHNLGVQHVTDLPELVLVGDQSAGKSSLMSGIAELDLPRSDGVCTRCPIHIRLTRARSWSCKVSLQLDYKFVTREQPITESDVTPADRFPPWVSQARINKDFKTFEDKHGDDQIVRALRWAQIAILNPNEDPEKFIPGRGEIVEHMTIADAEKTTEAKFSPNVVALNITGPELPDLSFYDMPGNFMNAGNPEDNYLVKVVENVVRNYISHEQAIIIWAVPMNADPETSKTWSMICDMNAQKRCVGVMTKADLVPRGKHAQWKSILDGTLYRTGYGYFITARRPDLDLPQQTAWEESFFNRIHEAQHDLDIEWPREFERWGNVCGVDRLKKTLSERLCSMFMRSLPRVEQSLFDRLAKVEAELAKLPELPGNPEFEVRNCLRKFSIKATEFLKAPEFTSQWSWLTEHFRDCLLDLKPRFNVAADAEQTSRVTVVIDDDRTGSPSPVPVTPSGRNKIRRPGDDLANGHAKRPRLAPYTPSRGIKRDPERNGDSPFQRSLRPSPAQSSPFRTIASNRPAGKTLSTIRGIINSRRRIGIPGEVPSEVKAILCEEAITSWRVPVQTFLEETMALIHDGIEAALDSVFWQMKERLVFKDAREHMKAFTDKFRAKYMDKFLYCYSLEARELHTLNTESFDRYRDNEKHILLRHRHFMRWRAATGEDTGPPKDWEKLSTEERGKENALRESQLQKLGKDMYADEIDVAAYVRGYYLTAALRFVDNITLHVIAGMIPDIIQDLEMYLDTKLNIMEKSDSAVFDRLMSENEETGSRRTSFKNDKNMVDKAIKVIRELKEEAGTNLDEEDVLGSQITGDSHGIRAHGSLDNGHADDRVSENGTNVEI